jgi:hypothetical protein
MRRSSSFFESSDEVKKQKAGEKDIAENLDETKLWFIMRSTEDGGENSSRHGFIEP